MRTREVHRIVHANRQTEGGGFVVRRPFPIAGMDLVDPFLLLDEMGPVDYAPGEAVGAPDHPHRGFETVTYMLSGEFEHEDSAGNRGSIRPGRRPVDDGWRRRHPLRDAGRLDQGEGRSRARLPALGQPARQDKRTAPRYQDVRAETMPTWRSEDGKATVKVIAGQAKGVEGGAQTRIPITYLDVTLARVQASNSSCRRRRTRSCSCSAAR